jgi:hypothetical protein
MLINVVGVEQRRFAEGGEQGLGDSLDQRLGVAVLAERREQFGRALAPAGEALCYRLVEGGEFGVT